MSDNIPEDLRPVIERRESDQELQEKFKALDYILLCVKSCEGINPKAIKLMLHGLSAIIVIADNPHTESAVKDAYDICRRALTKAKEPA